MAGGDVNHAPSGDDTVRSGAAERRRTFKPVVEAISVIFRKRQYSGIGREGSFPGVGKARQLATQ